VCAKIITEGPKKCLKSECTTYIQIKEKTNYYGGEFDYFLYSMPRD